ncbi:MAG: acyltransferase family protein [Rhodocyclaceae bacterium]|nr:acyltransferase family protein [Rhodocyclaceae bacterium]
MDSAAAAPPQRNAGIDIARGLGILLVVFGHNWIVQHDAGEMYRLIFSFHMPLFFFLSGVFLSPDKDFGQMLRQRADSLLKPYFVILLALALRYSIPPHAVTADYFIGMLYATGQSILWIPLWFLPSLFVVQLAAHALLQAPQLRGNKRRLLLLILGLLGAGVPLMHVFGGFHPMTLEILPGVERQLMGLPWSLDLLPVNLAYLLAGCLCAEYARRPERLAAFPVWLAAGIFLLLHAAFNDTLNMNGRLYDSLLVSSLEAFSGICLTLALAGYLSRHRRSATILAYLGEASLFIFIFHAIIQGQITGILQHRLPQWPWLWAWLGFLGGVAVPVLLHEVCRRSRLLSLLLLPYRRKQPFSGRIAASARGRSIQSSGS